MQFVNQLTCNHLARKGVACHSFRTPCNLKALRSTNQAPFTEARSQIKVSLPLQLALWALVNCGATAQFGIHGR
jgi:hypothetical protein